MAGIRENRTGLHSLFESIDPCGTLTQLRRQKILERFADILDHAH
jgi:hypothetical protein